MKKILLTLIAIGALVLLYVVFLQGAETPLPEPEVEDEPETLTGIRTEALFACAEGKRITASFTGGAAEIALDDGRLFELKQLPRQDEAEGDTAGYENEDGVLQFMISSGFATSAFLTEHGMTTYAECTALAEGNAALEARIDQAVGGAGVKIIPLEVLEDSRCPIDVVCIQAGTARLRALLSSGMGEAEQVFELGVPVTTEAEEVTLSSVLPAPRASQKIKPDDYKFYFSVVKR